MDIEQLYLKVEEFESNRSSDFEQKLECKNGCNQCCYTDISVFEIEANHIRQWFKNLTTEQKQKIQTQLTIPQESKENFEGETTEPCSFLHNNQCQIYEARPLICRTQGNALSFKEQDQEYLDICPLNEKALESLTSHDSLNLELVNTMLVQLNNYQGLSADRIPLKDLYEELKS